jgi:hypothetical protein
MVPYEPGMMTSVVFDQLLRFGAQIVDMASLMSMGFICYMTSRAKENLQVTLWDWMRIVQDINALCMVIVPDSTESEDIVC